MLIGIDASRAFQKKRTGIEEYSYQIIRHLRSFLQDVQVVLYCNPAINKKPDFEMPKNWKIKNLRAPVFWTQVRLSLEILLNKPDVLFIPAHTIPLFHSKNTIVTIHGLEYEFCPRAYSWFDRLYMRWSIRKSCRWAKRIIAVSENTKKDLIKLYKVPEEKIKVVYEGYSDDKFQLSTSSFQKIFNTSIFKSYLLFIGRLEERKNITGIVEAFEMLKERYKVPHKLILVGKFGFGAERIKNKINSSKYKSDIISTGFISDRKKTYLLKNAEVFLLPSFYEGFGLPILEAQSVGVPVITSNISSMPEISGEGAVLVDPKNVSEIVEAAYKLISDSDHKNDIIKRGLENVRRFSWRRCAKETADILMQMRE